MKKFGRSVEDDNPPMVLESLEALETLIQHLPSDKAVVTVAQSLSVNQLRCFLSGDKSICFNKILFDVTDPAYLYKFVDFKCGSGDINNFYQSLEVWFSAIKKIVLEDHEQMLDQDCICNTIRKIKLFQDFSEVQLSLICCSLRGSVQHDGVFPYMIPFSWMISLDVVEQISCIESFFSLFGLFSAWNRLDLLKCLKFPAIFENDFSFANANVLSHATIPKQRAHDLYMALFGFGLHDQMLLFDNPVSNILENFPFKIKMLMHKICTLSLLLWGKTSKIPDGQLNDLLDPSVLPTSLNIAFTREVILGCRDDILDTFYKSSNHSIMLKQADLMFNFEWRRPCQLENYLPLTNSSHLYKSIESNDKEDHSVFTDADEFVWENSLDMYLATRICNQVAYNCCFEFSLEKQQFNGKLLKIKKNPLENFIDNVNCTFLMKILNVTYSAEKRTSENSMMDFSIFFTSSIFFMTIHCIKTDRSELLDVMTRKFNIHHSTINRIKLFFNRSKRTWVDDETNNYFPLLPNFDCVEQTHILSQDNKLYSKNMSTSKNSHNFFEYEVEMEQPKHSLDVSIKNVHSFLSPVCAATSDDINNVQSNINMRNLKENNNNIEDLSCSIYDMIIRTYDLRHPNVKEALLQSDNAMNNFHILIHDAVKHRDFRVFTLIDNIFDLIINTNDEIEDTELINKVFGFDTTLNYKAIVNDFKLNSAFPKSKKYLVESINLQLEWFDKSLTKSFRIHSVQEHSQRLLSYQNTHTVGVMSSYNQQQQQRGRKRILSERNSTSFVSSSMNSNNNSNSIGNMSRSKSNTIATSSSTSIQNNTNSYQSLTYPLHSFYSSSLHQQPSALSSACPQYPTSSSINFGSVPVDASKDSPLLQNGALSCASHVSKRSPTSLYVNLDFAGHHESHELSPISLSANNHTDHHAHAIYHATNADQIRSNHDNMSFLLNTSIHNDARSRYAHFQSENREMNHLAHPHNNTNIYINRDKSEASSIYAISHISRFCDEDLLVSCPPGISAHSDNVLIEGGVGASVLDWDNESTRVNLAKCQQKHNSSNGNNNNLSFLNNGLKQHHQFNNKSLLSLSLVNTQNISNEDAEDLSVYFWIPGMIWLLSNGARFESVLFSGLTFSISYCRLLLCQATLEVIKKFHPEFRIVTSSPRDLIKAFSVSPACLRSLFVNNSTVSHRFREECLLVPLCLKLCQLGKSEGVNMLSFFAYWKAEIIPLISQYNKNINSADPVRMEENLYFCDDSSGIDSYLNKHCTKHRLCEDNNCELNFCELDLQIAEAVNWCCEENIDNSTFQLEKLLLILQSDLLDQKDDEQILRKCIDIIEFKGLDYIRKMDLIDFEDPSFASLRKLLGLSMEILFCLKTQFSSFKDRAGNALKTLQMAVK